MTAICMTLFNRSLEAERDLMSAIKGFETALGTDAEDDAFLDLDSARTAYWNVSTLLLASEIRANFASWAPDDARDVGAKVLAEALRTIAQNIEDQQEAGR